MLTQQTSLEAFDYVSPDVNNRQMSVLNAIKALGGRSTMHEAADQMKIPVSTISTRFSELCRKGLLLQVAIQRVPGQRGRTVFMVVEK